MLRYVTILKFCEMSGYSEDAVKSKRRDGIWKEGALWVKAPDGRILIDVVGYEAWVESSPSSSLPRLPSPLPLPLKPQASGKGSSPEPIV